MELFDQLFTMKDKSLDDKLIAKTIYEFMNIKQKTFEFNGPVRLVISCVPPAYEEFWIEYIYFCIITNYKKIVSILVASNSMVDKFPDCIQSDVNVYDCSSLDATSIDDIIDIADDLSYFINFDELIEEKHIPTLAELLPRTTKSSRS